MSAEAESTQRRGGIRFALSIVVSIVLVWWLLRDLGPGRVIETLRGVWWPGLLLGILTFALMNIARVVRYQVLLATPAPLVPLALITLVRGMLADLLPARLGTVSYVWLITTRTRVRLDDAWASFFLAFVLDMVVIAPLLLFALATVGFGTEASGALAIAASVLWVMSLAALALLEPGLRYVGRLLHSQVLVAAADRVDDVRRRRRLLPAVALSVVVRLAKFGAHYLVLQSVLVPLGVAWGSLGFWESFLGIAGAELSAMLPISGLGGFGTWEAAFAFGFTHLGLESEQAILAGFATHVLTQLHDYGLGIVALMLLMWPAGVRSHVAAANGRENNGATNDETGG